MFEISKITPSGCKDLSLEHFSLWKKLNSLTAVLTFIGYKQTDKHPNKQTEKPNLFIEDNFPQNRAEIMHQNAIK